jgi:hypothetical protein
MQQTAELLAVNKGDFGLAVAIEGNTVVVGAPTAISQTGLIYVYLRPSGGWVDTYPAAVLTASDNTYGSNFGGALSINNNTIVSGNFLGGTSRTGEAYIFVKPQLGWSDMTETARFSPPNGAQGFGLSVSICRNVAIISAPFTNAEQGIVYVFVRPKSGWKTTGTPAAYFQASDGQVGDVFGGAVSLSGTTALIGAYEHNVARGAAYVFGP